MREGDIVAVRLDRLGGIAAREWFRVTGVFHREGREDPDFDCVSLGRGRLHGLARIRSGEPGRFYEVVMTREEYVAKKMMGEFAWE